jgi:hypothetical protein
MDLNKVLELCNLATIEGVKVEKINLPPFPNQTQAQGWQC